MWYFQGIKINFFKIKVNLWKTCTIVSSEIPFSENLSHRETAKGPV